jgi:histidyl-tRNA synthetase
MVDVLPGFRDFYPEDCALRNYIFSTFRRVAGGFGFEEFDGPILEPLELFTEKSGPEIAEQLFQFQDRGGRSVALRPEMTPTLARMVGARAASLRRPIRWFTVGEHFRYERPQKGRLRAFYQMNLDLLGEKGVRGDGEVLAVLISSLRAFGLAAGDFQVRLSDRRLWFHFLSSFGVGDSSTPEVLGIMDRMGRVPLEITVQRLQTFFPTAAAVEKFLGAASSFCGCGDLNSLENFFSNLALPLAMERLGEWRELLQFLGALGLADFVTVDVGIVRGLAYYTGFVFEAFERTGESRALAGGGRYDDLVGKLTGISLPACGFAIGDVTLGNLLREKKLLPPPSGGCDFWIVFDGSAQAAALGLAQNLRLAGRSVLYALTPGLSMGKQLKLADRAGAKFAVLFGEESGSDGRCTLRNMVTGSEEIVASVHLVEKMTCPV